MPRFALALCLLPALGCAGTHPPLAIGAPGDAAHLGHDVASVEQHAAATMLERVEDEDTRYVEVTHFGECPYEAEHVPEYAPVDDEHVPQLHPERTRLSNMHTSDATLANATLLEHLDTATNEVLHCVSVAACYDPQATAEAAVEFTFEVEPSGDVGAVHVIPSDGLQQWGVGACARRAIYDTQFPPHDGADMIVSYRLQLD